MPIRPDRPLRTAPLVFFDLETTGLRPDRGGRICEIAVVDHDGIRLRWVSETDRPSDDVVARQLHSLLDTLRSTIVVGHNLQFDVHFLTYEFRRLSESGSPGLDIQFVDTLGLARRLRPHRDGHQLDVLARDLDLTPDAELHTAVGDARATQALFWHLVDEHDLETLSDVGAKRLTWNVG